MKPFHFIYVVFLLVLVTLEVCTLTYWNSSANRDWAAILHFVAGIGIALLPMVCGGGRVPGGEWRGAGAGGRGAGAEWRVPSGEWRVPDARRKSPPKSQQANFPTNRSKADIRGYVWWIGLCLWGLLALFVFFQLPALIQENPLDYRKADMLPIMKVMGERWLAGDAVYAEIPEIWGGMQPIYLPAMWLPFVPAIALGVDMRWASVLMLLLGVLLLFFISRDRKWHPVVLLSFIPVGLLFWYLFEVYSTFLTLSEEAVVVGWYMLLGFALFKRKAGWLAAGLVLCLLSRYVLLFWIPAYLLYLWMEGDKKLVRRTILFSVVGGLVLMFIGQGLSHLDVFIGLRGDYLGEITDPNKVGPFTSLIERGLGMARFVAYHQLPKLFYTQIGTAIVLPFLFLGFYLRKKDQLNSTFFGICSLKLSLVFFYNLLIMPYTYLFYTSVFLSIYILFSFLNTSTPSFSSVKR